MDQEFNLFGGNMLSEEQFRKMMDDEHAKMQQEAALRSNVPTEPQDMQDLGRNFQQMEQDLKRDRNEGRNKPPEDVFRDQTIPEAPAPAPGNQVGQLRFLPRGALPNELPYTPSPPLVPEVTPKLPTPAPRGPFKPLPDGQPGPGEPPLAPPRQLPSPPRPRLDASTTPFQLASAEQGEFWTPKMPSPFDAAMDRSVAKTRDWRYNDNSPASPWEANEFEGLKSWQKQKRDGEIPPSGLPFPDPPHQPNDAALPPNAQQTQATTTEGTGQYYRPREDKYPDAGRLPQTYRDSIENAPMIDFGRGLRTPQEKKEPREDYQDSLQKNEGFGMSPNELRRQQVVPPPTFDERFNVPPGEKPTAYDKFKSEIEQARRDAAAPKEHSPVKDFFGEALNTAMAVGPGGAPRGPFSGRMLRTENTMSAPAVGATPEMIKSAALKLRGQIYEGENHGEAFVKAGEPSDMRGFQDGFTTTHGRFVSRQEAMEIAQRNDQTKRQPAPDSRNPEDYRLQSEDLIPRTRGEGAATYTPRDEGQLSPNARVQRGFGDPENGGSPTPPRPQGRPTNGRSKAMDAAEEANPRQPADQGEKRQGFRQYGTDQGEIGPKDRALRSVRRTEGVPPEEAQTKNLERFPPGYFDRVPRERRQMGAGLSHPGFRWQIMENGNAIGTPQMNKLKANARADKMTSTYNTRYTVAPRPAGESELTPSERSYLQKYEINIPRSAQ